MAKKHDKKGEIQKALTLLEEAKSLDAKNRNIDRWLKKVKEKVQKQAEEKRKAEEIRQKEEEERKRKEAERHRKAEAARKKAEQEKLLQLAGEMVFVQGGTFYMGSDDSYVDDNEKPVHQVTLDDFYIGKYPVTQKQWEAVMGTSTTLSAPSHFKGRPSCPVETVSWDDAQDYIKKINKMTGKKFHLPTEAEWEYAARGGNKSRGYKYAGSNNLDDVGWNSSNSGFKTHPVGQKKPNELGIYDMSGNVWEWCNDWFAEDYYENCPRNNPQGPSSGSDRVVRGGGCLEYGICLVAVRMCTSPAFRSLHLGFRLSRSVD